MQKRTGDEIFWESLLTGDSSQAILNQEKRGQGDLIRSEVLPIDMQGTPRETVEAMGIVFGEVVDDLFIRVTLPTGWGKIATDHSMWSHLVDAQGRNRAAIFYKAAFYDRSAHISFNRRYNATYEPTGGWDNQDREHPSYVGLVKDGDTVIWRSDSVMERDDVPRYELLSMACVLSEAWLNEHYHEWQNVLMYWD